MNSPGDALPLPQVQVGVPRWPFPVVVLNPVDYLLWLGSFSFYQQVLSGLLKDLGYMCRGKELSDLGSMNIAMSYSPPINIALSA